MTIRILALSSPGEVRAVAVRDGALLDVAIHRPGKPDGVGDLHRGRIIATVPAMAGAFVALDDAEAFLPDSEGAAGRSNGDLLTVQITRAAQGGKGPRVTARLVGHAVPEPLPSRSSSLLARGPGATQRLVALYPDAAVLADTPGLLAHLRSTLGSRVSLAQEDDCAIAAELDDFVEPGIALPGGMHASITPTPALIAIDVDSGSSSADRRPKQAAQFAANRAALPEIAHHIRLRNLSGAILLDLAGLSTHRRAALGPDLTAALATDPLRPRLLGFTRLGLAEIVRPRVHPPLHELLSGPHATGLKALRTIQRNAASQPARHWNLRAAPDVVAALQADPVALPDLAHSTGRSLLLHSDPTLPPSSAIILEA